MSTFLQRSSSFARYASKAKIVQGTLIRIGDKQLIPIFSTSSWSYGGNGLTVCGDISLKGVVTVEKGIASYVPVDGEDLSITKLKKTVRGLAKTLGGAKARVKRRRKPRRTK